MYVPCQVSTRTRKRLVITIWPFTEMKNKINQSEKANFKLYREMAINQNTFVYAFYTEIWC